MNRTIISVYGKANQGKSETIKKVCSLLLETYPDASPSISNIDYSGDIFLTITIGNVKIGLESQGDPNSRMIHDNTVERLAKDNCDIIVCATRTGGMTVKEVDRVANIYDYHTIWHSSLWSPSLNFNVLNRQGAENIISLIKSLITQQL
ncbi:hypothetical protein [Tenacibaculum sp. 47A_GOM-205m]|uniref:hypothetical protein n=1 Tax=Tenacibaculum sp. 47A_GOM-205m TaxID=1380384 RepID=UPI00048E3A51|nr:hypothetical protein [Tenacibaculum sp. 47A_GOM-205m]